MSEQSEQEGCGEQEVCSDCGRMPGVFIEVDEGAATKHGTRKSVSACRTCGLPFTVSGETVDKYIK